MPDCKNMGEVKFSGKLVCRPCRDLVMYDAVDRRFSRGLDWYDK